MFIMLYYLMLNFLWDTKVAIFICSNFFASCLVMWPSTTNSFSYWVHSLFASHNTIPRSFLFSSLRHSCWLSYAVLTVLELLALRTAVLKRREICCFCFLSARIRGMLHHHYPVLMASGYFFFLLNCCVVGTHQINEVRQGPGYNFSNY